MPVTEAVLDIGMPRDLACQLDQERGHSRSGFLKCDECFPHCLIIILAVMCYKPLLIMADVLPAAVASELPEAEGTLLYIIYSDSSVVSVLAGHVFHPIVLFSAVGTLQQEHWKKLGQHEASGMWGSCQLFAEPWLV